MVIQVVPKGEIDAYKLLRNKVSHKASTWYWNNKAKTRLKHINSGGYLEVGDADGILIARVYPKSERDLFYLVEKFMGRLVAWFEDELVAVNMQFTELGGGKERKKKGKR